MGELVLLTLWSLTETGEMNPVLVALIVGRIGELLLPTRWKSDVTIRLLVFFGPVIVVLLLAALLDDRLGAKLLFGICAAFFGLTTLWAIGDIEVGNEALVVRSFGVLKRQIPYELISSVGESDTAGGCRMVTIGLTGETSQARRRKLSLQLLESDASDLATEVRRRLPQVPAS